MKSLRAFEAAARYKSFKKAADELAVTPVAVTHQIKVLEEDLGFSLFVRRNRGVELTEAGLLLHADISPHILAIWTAVAGLRRSNISRHIRIGVDHAFAERWLKNRLADFHSRHATIAVDLELPGYSDGKRDGTIYYGASFVESEQCHKILDEYVFPVCTLSYAKSSGLGADPAKLKGDQLIHEGGLDWWRRWLENARVKGTDIASGVVFLSPSEVHDLALAGKGVALGDSILTRVDLTAGRLIKPFKSVLKGGSYALAYHRPEDEAMTAFRLWLSEQSQQFMSDVHAELAA